MERTWTTDIAGHAGQRVLLQGWLHHYRQLSNVNFLLLRDARGLAQVVIEDTDLAAQVACLKHETVLEIEGIVRTQSQAPGGVEVAEPQVRVLAEPIEEPPLDVYRPKLRAQLPTILDLAPLTLRHPARRACFRIADTSVEGFRQTLRQQGFVEIHTSKLVASATESGANVFPVDYFGRPAFLAQSPQLYKQAMVGVFERVYEIGPVFRAEPHDSTRHLNEYTSLDVEMAFIRDHTDVMAVLRDVIAGMLDAVRSAPWFDGAQRQLAFELPAVSDEIPSIHFTDAQRLMSAETSGDQDLSPTQEAWLGDWARREFGSDFLFVTGYPTAKRAFYTHPDPTRPEFSNSFDLLFRGLELVSGGQRLHLHDDYVRVLTERGFDLASFEGYLQAFKYGMPPHGGFAIGLERWVARIVGAANVRETTLFPRDLRRLTP